jgi:hypothetical protein
VTHHKQLDILGRRRAAEQYQPLQQPNEDQIEQTQVHSSRSFRVSYRATSPQVGGVDRLLEPITKVTTHSARTRHSGQSITRAHQHHRRFGGDRSPSAGPNSSTVVRIEDLAKSLEDPRDVHRRHQGDAAGSRQGSTARRGHLQYSDANSFAVITQKSPPNRTAPIAARLSMTAQTDPLRRSSTGSVCAPALNDGPRPPQLGELLDTGLRELVLDLSAIPRHDPETNRTLACLRDRLRMRGGHLIILAGDQTLTGALDDPHEDSRAERTANLAAHCDRLPRLPTRDRRGGGGVCRYVPRRVAARPTDHCPHPCHEGRSRRWPRVRTARSNTARS